MTQVCFDSSSFYTIMIVGISIIIYVIITLYKEKLNEQYVNIFFSPDQQPSDDARRIYDPLVPPLRRGPMSGLSDVTTPVNTPSRGEYGAFQQLGFLHNTDDIMQAMPLMGRRLHSNQYEYYTFHHNNPHIKIPLKLQSNKELNDGETIDVHGYDAPMSVKLYELDYPRYIPY